MTNSTDFKEYLRTIRNHRKDNYWDVCYESDIDLSQFSLIPLLDAVNPSKGRIKISCKNISIQKDDLVNINIAPDKSLFLERVEFDICDFHGNNVGRKITFEDCAFHKCYFSFSEFNDVNFVNCKFESCSFAQAKFYRCIFDDSCTFYKISISGGKTKFINSEINAVKMFRHLYKAFDKDSLHYKKDNLSNERYRLARSVVKLSRNILESNQSCANDDLYFIALKNLYLMKLEERRFNNLKIISDVVNNIKKKIHECSSRENKEYKYFLKNISKTCFLWCKKPAFYIEHKIIHIFGFANAWGGSLQRLFLLGFLILIGFGTLYFFVDDGYVNHLNRVGMVEKIHVEGWYRFLSSFIKSFDVTFLAGYTKHITNSDGLFKQLLLLSNMLLGLFWYAVAIPSLINKISVTRL